MYYFPDVKLQTFHQCMTGQKGPSGLPAKKPTGILSNEEDLRDAVKPFWCDGSHEHDQHVSGKHLEKLQLWTWTLAIALANAAVKVCRRAHAMEATAGSLAECVYVCKGCKYHLDKTDPMHSRDPSECKFPHVKPVIWDCIACRNRQGLLTGDHTFKHGQCKSIFGY